MCASSRPRTRGSRSPSERRAPSDATCVYRLNVIELKMPPLRKCREDIPMIPSEAVLAPRSRGRPARPPAAAAVGGGAGRAEGLNDYPGNVRELENILERGLSLAADPLRITVEDLHLTPVPEEADRRHAGGREMAAAGLPRPRRAARDQRSPGKDALQPHRRRQAARDHLSRDALPDGTVWASK